ncbi:MAG: FMN-binding negative transcriptional regulator [Litoreibacter sp.]
MHPNPIFASTPRDRNIAFARDRAFGTLAVNGENGPLTAHIPFVLDEAGTRVELHLMRSNPITRALSKPVKAVLTVLGPDGYISPDWYDLEDQVPTWNYIAVRICGTLTLEPQDKLHSFLDRLSTHMETKLAPKPVWNSEKMSDGVMQRMMRSIAPFSMEVECIEGTWKLNQNKPDTAREAAANRMRAFDVGQETSALADLMLVAMEKSKSSSDV